MTTQFKIGKSSKNLLITRKIPVKKSISFKCETLSIKTKKFIYCEKILPKYWHKHLVTIWTSTLCVVKIDTKSSALISSHSISCQIISSHFILFHLISFYFISSHLIVFYLISSHFILSQFNSFHTILSHYISFHTISHILPSQNKCYYQTSFSEGLIQPTFCLDDLLNYKCSNIHVNISIPHHHQT